MLALLEHEFTEKRSWLSRQDFLDMAAIAESTPGPLAVNSATYIGYRMAGVRGAVVSTFAVLLLIASVLHGFLKRPAVEGVLSGIRPGVVAMILATAVAMALTHLCGLGPSGSGSADGRGFLLLALLFALHALMQKRTGRAPSPIAMLLLSAGLGVVFYGAFRVYFTPEYTICSFNHSNRSRPVSEGHGADSCFSHQSTPQPGKLRSAHLLNMVDIVE